MEGEVTTGDFRSGVVLLSITRLATEFGMARETVAKRLAAHGVEPEGERYGYPTYRLGPAARAICDGETGGGVFDPRELSPAARGAWFRSELDRMNVEMRQRKLLPVDEVRDEFASLIGAVVQFLDTLPDQLERDVGLTPDQVDALHAAIALQREASHARIAGDWPCPVLDDAVLSGD